MPIEMQSSWLLFLQSQKVCPKWYQVRVNLICLQANQKYDNNVMFWKFKWQMYHNTITAILSPLKPAMISPVICWYLDRHFWWIIYDLAAYLADYPEQVYLSGTVQNWCLKYINSSFLQQLALIIYFIDIWHYSTTLMAKELVDIKNTPRDYSK